MYYNYEKLHKNKGYTVFQKANTKHCKKMKSYNVDVGKFIRDAVSEKIKREYYNLIPKEKSKCPF